MKKYFAFFATAALLSFPVAGQARDNHSNHNNNGNSYNSRGGRSDHDGYNGGYRNYDRSHSYYRPLRPYAYQPYYYRPQERVVILSSPPAYYQRETVFVDRTYSPYSYADEQPYYVSNRYRVGSYAPRSVHWRTVPSWYADNLPPVRRGERYVYADRDVLLVDSASRILSALVLASAID